MIDNVKIISEHYPVDIPIYSIDIPIYSIDIPIYSIDILRDRIRTPLPPNIWYMLMYVRRSQGWTRAFVLN